MVRLRDAGTEELEVMQALAQVATRKWCVEGMQWNIRQVKGVQRVNCVVHTGYVRASG